MRFVDTHCHLDFPDFDEDRDDILARCQALQIDKLILSGVYPEDWPRLVNFCQTYDSIYATPGLHPCYLKSDHESFMESLEQLVQFEPKAVGIGETGLDFFIKDFNEPLQYQAFENQIDLAKKAALPLVLHVRKAHDQAVSLLRKKRFSHGGIVHCYSGSLQQAKRYLDIGFKLGVGGVITYQRSSRLRNIVSDLPLSSFVLETDAPDIPIYGRERQRNSPQYLREIFEAFLSLRQESPEDVNAGLYKNTLEIFKRLTN